MHKSAKCRIGNRLQTFVIPVLLSFLFLSFFLIKINIGELPIFFLVFSFLFTINNKSKMEKYKKLKTQLDYPVQRRGQSWMAVQPQTGGGPTILCPLLQQFVNDLRCYIILSKSISGGSLRLS